MPNVGTMSGMSDESKPKYSITSRLSPFSLKSQKIPSESPETVVFTSPPLSRMAM